MISVTFKFPRVIDERIGDRLVRSALTVLGDLARSEWVRLAQKNLRTTQQDYIAGIGSPVVLKDRVEIALTGKIAHMVELGWEGGDLRKTVLGPGNAKKSKAGHYYAHVPFRHSTPGTVGYQGQQMPKGVYAAARKLRETLTGPGRKFTLWGDRLPAGMSPLARPHHTTSIHAGMVRKGKTYAASSGGSYTTFRTISNNPGTRAYRTPSGGVHRGSAPPRGSTEVGWIHPGIKAHLFAQDVAAYLDSVAGAVVDKAVSS